MDVENKPTEAIVTETKVDVTPAPAAQAVTETPAPSVQEYELPDGRKVDASTLAKEWGERFMPEYTRKSQELSALKAKAQPKEAIAPSDGPAPWKDPQWQPQSYEQLAASIQEQVYKELLDTAQAEEREKQERDDYVNKEIEELKSLDSKVDVSRVMAHAAKYAFPSLLPAYQNMKAIEDAERRVEERVLKNMQARSVAPVGAPSGGNKDVAPPTWMSPLEKARWALKNNK